MATPLPVSPRVQRSTDDEHSETGGAEGAIAKATAPTNMALVTPSRVGPDPAALQRASASGEIAAATDVKSESSDKATESEIDIEKYLPTIADAVWKEFRRRLRSERERSRGRL
jgi:hypothetical protein